MKKTMFLILLVAMLAILISCTSPSTATVIPPTQTPPSTATAFPPTPVLSGLLLSDETLSTETDGAPRYILSSTGWEPISPEVLSDELVTNEGWDYSRSEQDLLQIVDIEGNPIWIEKSGLWIQFSAEFPEEFQVVNNGQNLVDVNGKLLILQRKVRSEKL